MLLPQGLLVAGLELPQAAAWPDRGLLLRVWGRVCQPAGEPEHSGLSQELSPRSKPHWVCPEAGRAQGAVPKRSGC